MEKYNCENGALTVKINSIKYIHASVSPINDRKYLVI
jgi:membrane-bound inhibitor of C-type lysozyme